MSTNVDSFTLEIPVVKGPGRGQTFLMDNVTVETSVDQVCQWVLKQVPPGGEDVKHRVASLYFEDYGRSGGGGDVAVSAKLGDLLSYDQPVPCRIYDFEEGAARIVVKHLTGRTSELDVRLENRVGDVLSMIDVKEGIPPDQQRLVFEGQPLKDVDARLGDVGIRNGSVIHLVLRLRGGAPDNFVDVTRSDALKKSGWDNSAPPWREADRGLTIEGRCPNKACVAFSRMVITNHRFDKFDLFGKKKCNCPICNSAVVPVKPGFNNCFWRIRARKEGTAALFSTPWARAGDNYTTYDEHQAGTAEWAKLEIFVRPLRPPTFKVPVPDDCAVCFERLRGASGGAGDDDLAKMPSCSHHFHRSCIDEWSRVLQDSGRELTCPLCREVSERAKLVT